MNTTRDVIIIVASIPAIIVVTTDSTLSGTVLTCSPKELTKKVVDKSLENGLILFYFLFSKTSFRITPPLTISDEEIINGCEIIKGILEG